MKPKKKQPKKKVVTVKIATLWGVIDCKGLRLVYEDEITNNVGELDINTFGVPTFRHYWTPEDLKERKRLGL